MTLFVLKLIAVITMVIDNTGLICFPDQEIFRMIGRVAFPIFAWGIANGYRHTSSVKKYLYRLLILAAVSQIPYSLILGTVYGTPWRMNIFVTLAMGLLTIVVYERFRTDKVVQILSMLGMMALGFLFPTGYGIYGLVMILLFHMTYGKAYAMILWQSMWMFVVIELAQEYSHLFPYGVLRYLSLPSAIQYYSLATLPLIALHSNNIGYNKHKWWFYWFYPVHLGVLYILYLFG